MSTSRERVVRELAVLQAGAQQAELIRAEDGGAGRDVVLYRDVPTAGVRLGLPVETDVIVPVPAGYPAAMIDLAGLPVDSPLLSRLKGGTNNQGVLAIANQRWQLASYHPHNGGGGPPWDQTQHGFHTYLDHLIAWLDQLQ